MSETKRCSAQWHTCERHPVARFDPRADTPSLAPAPLRGCPENCRGRHRALSKFYSTDAWCVACEAVRRQWPAVKEQKREYNRRARAKKAAKVTSAKASLRVHHPRLPGTTAQKRMADEILRERHKEEWLQVIADLGEI